MVATDFSAQAHNTIPPYRSKRTGGWWYSIDDGVDHGADVDSVFGRDANDFIAFDVKDAVELICDDFRSSVRKIDLVHDWDDGQFSLERQEEIVHYNEQEN